MERPAPIITRTMRVLQRIEIEFTADDMRTLEGAYDLGRRELNYDDRTTQPAKFASDLRHNVLFARKFAGEVRKALAGVCQTLTFAEFAHVLDKANCYANDPLDLRPFMLVLAVNI